jgi:hypothetical protein
MNGIQILLILIDLTNLVLVEVPFEDALSHLKANQSVSSKRGNVSSAYRQHFGQETVHETIQASFL